VPKGLAGDEIEGEVEFHGSGHGGPWRTSGTRAGLVHARMAHASI
jgi:hypothetical protein